MTDLTPYLPRLVLDWHRDDQRTSRQIVGTLVFADVSGFTALSERLARGGREGAEEITDVIDRTFTELLVAAYQAGGTLLKFGGDALLLFFQGRGHAERAAFAAWGMRKALRDLNPIQTSAGKATLRISMAVHSDTFHFFLVGSSHRELVLAGPGATQTVALEGAAGAGEILLSPSASAHLPPGDVGAAKAGGRLLRRAPAAPTAEAEATAALTTPDPEVASCVPRAIRTHIEGGGGEPEHRTITVAFLRFVGLDAIIGGAGPGRAAELLEVLVTTTQAAVDEQDVCFLGTDVYEDGGKILLVAGTPRAHGNDEERMLRALRDVIDAHEGLELRVGVNRGGAFCGDVGPAYRRTYTVMGDAVNTAARVMAKAGPGQILATAGVLERSPTLFATTALEPFAVKGKSEPISASSVGAVTGSRTSAMQSSLPFVSREAELDRLLREVDAARSGTGALIDIVAEAGAGKSRLIAEARARRPEANWVEVQGQQYECTTPYFVAGQLLRRVLGIDETAQPDAVGRVLRRRVLELAPDLEPWLPLLGLPLDVEFPSTPQIERLDPKFIKTRLHALVDELLTAGVTSPTVFVIEDAQWMDAASAEFFGSIAGRLAERPWLVLLAREPDPPVLPAGTTAVVLDVPPLDTDASVALARAASSGALLPDQAALFALRAGGNPLFIQELVRAAEEQAMDDVPDSIETVIAARIDQLGPRDRTTLRRLAVLGQAFPISAVKAVAPSAGSGVLGRLGHFLERGPGQVRFKQALFQAVAYQGLPFKHRRALHAEVGEFLERGDVTQETELLSLHFHEARDYRRSWRYSQAAAHRAIEKYAYTSAVLFYRRAIEAGRQVTDVPPPDLARVWHALGHALYRAGHVADATAAYQKARALTTDDPATQSRLLFLEGVARSEQGRFSQAVRWYGRGLRALDRSSAGGDRVTWTIDGRRADARVRLLNALADVRYRQGRYDDSLVLGRQALGEAERNEDQAGTAHAYHQLFLAAWATGSRERTAYGEAALAAAEEVGNLVLRAGALNLLGIDAHAQGRWDDALRLYRQAKTDYQDAGAVTSAALASNNVAEILADQGHLDEARMLFEVALSTLEAAGLRPYVLGINANLGRLAARAGRFDEATSLLTGAARGFRAIGAESAAAESDVLQSENLLFEGRYHEAIAAVQPALDRLPATRRPLAHRVLGAALAQLGSPDEARHALEESVRLARSAGAEFDVAMGCEALAGLVDQLGEDPGAYAEEAKAIFDRLGIVSATDEPLDEQVEADRAGSGVSPPRSGRRTVPRSTAVRKGSDRRPEGAGRPPRARS